MSQNLRKPDKSIPWMLVACIAVPLVLVGIAQWGLWAFLFGVFA